MTTALALTLLPQVLKLIELGMQRDLERIKHMTPDQAEAYWARHEKWDAFWWNVLEKIMGAIEGPQA